MLPQRVRGRPIGNLGLFGACLVDGSMVFGATIDSMCSGTLSTTVRLGRFIGLPAVLLFQRCFLALATHGAQGNQQHEGNR